MALMRRAASSVRAWRSSLWGWTKAEPGSISPMASNTSWLVLAVP